MDTALLILAIVIALVSVPTTAGMTAWGLAGGDGDPSSGFAAFLGAVVGYGAMYNAVTCWLAFFGIAEWQWWLMWAPPVAGIFGLILSAGESSGEETAVDYLVGGLIQGSLAIPAVLVWLAGANGM